MGGIIAAVVAGHTISDEAHATLAYLGDGADHAGVVEFVAALAGSRDRFRAKIGGHGALGPKRVPVLFIESADLVDLRKSVVGFDTSKFAWWYPHVSISYEPYGDHDGKEDRSYVVFDRLAVWDNSVDPPFKAEFPLNVPMQSVVAALEFACHSDACAPPPHGTGGSLPGGTGGNEYSDVGWEKLDRGGVKHEGSIRVAANLTSVESRNIRETLDYVDSSGDDIIIWDITERAASLGIPTGMTVGIAAQLSAVNDFLYIPSYAGYRDLERANMHPKVYAILDAHEQRIGERMGETESIGILSKELTDLTGVTIESGFVSHINSMWAMSSTSPESVMMQITAAEAHSLTPAMESMKNLVTRDEMTEVMPTFHRIRKALHAVHQATYRTTQEEFERQGVTEVTLYRGLQRGKSASANLDKVIAQGNPLSSWSTSESEAATFGDDGRNVYKMRIPVSQVYSAARHTGLGSLSEREMVVLGFPTTASRVVPEYRGEEFSVAEPPILYVDDTQENADWIKRPDALTAACHSAECAPPPAGTGGSLPASWSEGAQTLPDDETDQPVLNLRTTSAGFKSAVPDEAHHERWESAMDRFEVAPSTSEWLAMTHEDREAFARKRRAGIQAAYGTTESFGPGEIHASQNWLREPDLTALVGETIRDRPVAVRYGGEVYAMDGHHRIASQWAAGRESEVNVIDLERMERGIPYGSGDLDTVFNGAVTTGTPWPRVSTSKSQKMGYPVHRIADALRTGDFDVREIETRGLKSTQPSITRDGVSHYLTSSDLYADQTSAVNSMPTIYARSDGQRVIVSGHHRAAAAYVAGRKLLARVIIE